MEKQEGNVKHENTPEIKQADIDNIKTLIANLSSKDSIVRVRARSSLVALGHQAVKYLLPAIQREFVWDTYQIARLFDSLMRDYPIKESKSLAIW